MGERNRKFVDDISTNKKVIIIPKTEIFDIDFDKSKIKPVKPGTYERVIIIATNIAEASITIDTLKYVIDNGLQNSGVYNPITRTTDLIRTYISESSRIQRRGRVGRVSDGIVYYLYEKDKMTNNKRQYDISTSDLSDVFFDLLNSNNNNNNNKLFTQDNDPNITHNKIIKYKHNFDLIYNLQYSRLIDSKTDIKSDKNIYTNYLTGIDYNTINDEYGTYYIIHPEELNIKRNIIGKIVGLVDNDNNMLFLKNNKIESSKMKIFWSILQDNLFVLYDKENMLKTDFGINAYEIKPKINFGIEDTKYLLSYIYSLSYNCDSEILILIALLNTIRTPKDLILFKQMEKIKQIYTTNEGNGDCITLIKIGKKIIDYINSLIKNINTDINRKNLDLKEQKSKFIKGLKTNNFNDINQKVLSKFIKMYNTNELNIYDDNILDYESSSIISDDINIQLQIDLLDKLENEISDWATKNLFNYNSVISFYKKYLYYLNDTKKIKKENIDNLIKYTPAYNNYNINNNIQAVLIHTYNYNIVSRIGDTKYYLNIFDPIIDNIFTISKMFKSDYIKLEDIPYNTYLTNNWIGNTLLYINKDQDQMNFINNVDINLVLKIIPQSFYSFYLENYDIENIEKLKNNMLNYLKRVNINIQNKTIFFKYIRTIELLKNTIIQNYNINNLDRLNKISSNIKNVNSIIKNQKKQININIQTIGNINRIPNIFVEEISKL